MDKIATKSAGRNSTGRKLSFEKISKCKINVEILFSLYRDTQVMQLLCYELSKNRSIKSQSNNTECNKNLIDFFVFIGPKFRVIIILFLSIKLKF